MAFLYSLEVPALAQQMSSRAPQTRFQNSTSVLLGNLVTGRFAFSCFLCFVEQFGSDPKAGSWSYSATPSLASDIRFLADGPLQFPPGLSGSWRLMKQLWHLRQSLGRHTVLGPHRRWTLPSSDAWWQPLLTLPRSMWSA